MQQFRKLAIAGAVSALMMSAGVAQAHVSYNVDSSVNGNAASGAGTWTGGVATGYTGNLPVNWEAHIHQYDTDYTASTAGVADEEDEAGITPHSGYVLKSVKNKWNPDHSWGAALGFGLIDLHESGDLTIDVKADASLGSTFTPGFTVFSGWDTSATSSKHQAWNLDEDNPDMLGAAGLAYLGHSATTTAGGTTTLTLTDLAAGHYSIWIGGNGAGKPTANQQYTANFNVSAVPVPAAAWLMGSAILGLAGMRRKVA